MEPLQSLKMAELNRVCGNYRDVGIYDGGFYLVSIHRLTVNRMCNLNGSSVCLT